MGSEALVVSTLVDRADGDWHHGWQLVALSDALADPSGDRCDCGVVVVFPLGCPAFLCNASDGTDDGIGGAIALDGSQEIKTFEVLENLDLRQGGEKSDFSPCSES